MHRLFGLILLVLGTVLLVWGLDASHSVGSQISKVFSGAPTEKSIWLVIGGAAAGLVGLGLLVIPRGDRSPRV